MFLKNKNNYERYFTGDFIVGKVIVTPLPPIPTEGLTSDDVDKLIERTREVMIATFQEVNKEVKETVEKEAITKSFFKLL